MQNITGDDIEGNDVWFLASDLSGASLRGTLFQESFFYWKDGAKLPPHLSKEIQKRLLSTWQDFDPADKKTKMQAANLQASDFHSAFLQNVILIGSLLQGADLTNADFTEANCLGTQFIASNVTNTIFKKADLTSTDFSDSGSASPESPPQFSGANLEDAKLKGMDLSSAVFKDLESMEGADFTDCRLIGAQFYSTSTDGQHNKLNIKRATFRNARLDRATFRNVSLQASDLSFSSGSSQEETPTIFERCNLRLAGLRALDFTKITWRGCDLEKADLSDSQIGEAVFEENCNLDTTKFADATIKYLKVDRAKSLSTMNFEGATIGDEAGKMSEIVGSDKLGELKSFSALSFDRSSMVNVRFANIGIGSSSFKYMLFENVEFIKAYIFSGEFVSSGINFSSIEDCNFLYCDFVKSSVQATKSWHLKPSPETTSVFLGCNFNSSSLLEEPAGIVFADCRFNASSFLATKESAKGWAKALLIQCTFSGQKYHGIKDTEHDIKSGSYSNDLITLKDFLEAHCAQLHDKENNNRLETVRKRANENFPFYTWTKRLGTLIPIVTAREKSSYRHASAYELCREIRKDLLACGLTETAAIAYVLERNHYNDTMLWKQLAQEPLNFIKKLLNNTTSEWWQLADAVKTFIQVPFCLCLGAVIVLLIATMKWAAVALAGPALTLCILGVTTKGRLFLSKHLYDYGESVGKMLWAAISCVIAFAILYYAFVPNLESTSVTNLGSSQTLWPGTNEACCPEPPPELLNSVSLFEQLSIPSQCPASGYLVDGKCLLTKTSWRDWDAILTCLYMSGVTFTTLGYGDIHPVGLVRFLAIMEAGIGASLMALFVFSFTRRNAQR
jgi:uncharacterized protein YjbI with pentapeptide repeats